MFTNPAKTTRSGFPSSPNGGLMMKGISVSKVDESSHENMPKTIKERKNARSLGVPGNPRARLGASCKGMSYSSHIVARRSPIVRGVFCREDSRIPHVRECHGGALKMNSLVRRREGTGETESLGRRLA
jgi:hypothetical protein